MNEEQLTMFNKLTKLQRECALVRIAKPTLNNIEVYRKAGGKAKDDDTARTCAAEILANPRVKEFIASFAVERAHDAIMGRDEMMARLSAAARTDVTDVVKVVNTDHELMDVESGEIYNGQTFWQLRDVDDMPRGALGAIKELSSGKDGLKVKLHDQHAAMKQLAELQGFNAPTKTELSGPGGGPIQSVQLTPEQLATLNKDLEDEF